MNEATESKKRPVHPFRRAVLRGLGIVLPPLLTIVVFLWAWNLIENYVLKPVSAASSYASAWCIMDVYSAVPTDLPGSEVIRVNNRIIKFRKDEQQYVPLASGEWIPEYVYETVQKDPGDPAPKTGFWYYNRYASITFLRASVMVPAFLCVFLLVLYGVGKLMAAGAGRILWNSFESIIHRLPIIRNVYSSVKQVTDFVFSEQEIQFNRVVAVEYPRKGVWSIGFVTGESMLDIQSAANQPVLSVLMPTSPMPMTGFTITVLKSETVDLNITVDQAIQFVVSCGVVIPSQQLQAPQQPQAPQISSKISTAPVLPELGSSNTGPSGNGQSGKSLPERERGGWPQPGNERIETDSQAGADGADRDDQ